MKGKDNYDVIVVGAGAAGLAASVASARAGARTLLVERYGSIGGTTTVGLVHHWDPVKLIEAGGLVTTVYNSMKSKNGLIDFDKDFSKMPFSYWEGGCGFDPECFKSSWIELLERYNVNFLPYSTVVDVLKHDVHIKALQLLGRDGMFSVSGKVFIDASGDGYLAYYSGCRNMVSDFNSVMAPTLAFTIGGVDTEAIYKYLDDNPDQFGLHPRLGRYMKDWRHSALIQGFYQLIETARANGDLWAVLPETGLGLLIQPRYGEFHVNASRAVSHDLMDPWDVAEVIHSENANINNIFNFIKKYIPGGEGAYIIATADLLGMRETRRFEGEHILTLEELKSGRKPDDAVIRLKWAHGDTHSGVDMKWSFSMIEGPYWIPLGSLLAKDIDNLFITGRCASYSEKVLASLRIQPICMLTGEVAGIAAAKAVNDGALIRDVHIAELQSEIMKNNIGI